MTRHNLANRPQESLPFAFAGGYRFPGAGSSRRGGARPQQVLIAGEEESPWDRFGLVRKRRRGPVLRRALSGVSFVMAWLAMPLAVLTCHGWLGLLVHGIALSGAAGWLQRGTIQTRIGLLRVDGLESDGACASMSERN